MNNIKEGYVEPKDRNALARVAQEYRNRVNAPGSLGAVLMAVCRGKVRHFDICRPAFLL